MRKIKKKADASRIKEMSEEDFNKKYTVARVPSGLADERAWFALDGKKGSTLGIVFVDRIDEEWSWVVMRSRPDGMFGAVDVGVDEGAEATATAALMKKMVRHHNSKTVWK